MIDRTKELEHWWTTLTDEQRAELLPLERGERLPGGYVVGLTHALGIGPAGAKWEAQDGYTFFVPESLAEFLARKRNV